MIIMISDSYYLCYYRGDLGDNDCTDYVVLTKTQAESELFSARPVKWFLAHRSDSRTVELCQQGSTEVDFDNNAIKFINNRSKILAYMYENYYEILSNDAIVSISSYHPDIEQRLLERFQLESYNDENGVEINFTTKNNVLYSCQYESLFVCFEYKQINSVCDSIITIVDSAKLISMNADEIYDHILKRYFDIIGVQDFITKYETSSTTFHLDGDAYDKLVKMHGEYSKYYHVSPTKKKKPKC
jgi:hypothetical protein